MSRFSPAPAEIVCLVEEVIGLHHEDLKEAKIGLLVRDEAPITNGFATLGQARKVTPEYRAIMDFDFIIWFAQDEWDRLSFIQRKALADHELCHCAKFGRKTAIRKHDFEEFNCIIERYGFWRPMARYTERAVHMRLGLEVAAGRVEPVNLDKTRGDILDQIDDLFGNEEA